MNLDKHFCVIVFRAHDTVDLSRAKDIEYVKSLLDKSEVIDGMLTNGTAKEASHSILSLFTRLISRLITA